MEKTPTLILAEPGLAAEILPFYGFRLEWRFLMTSLHPQTRQAWADHRVVFLKLSAAFRAEVVSFERFGEEAMAFVETAPRYCYYRFRVNSAEEAQLFRKFHSQLSHEFYIKARIYEGT